MRGVWRRRSELWAVVGASNGGAASYAASDGDSFEEKKKPPSLTIIQDSHGHSVTSDQLAELRKKNDLFVNF
ncbi:hypothetical protein AV530_013903 [Patagioenas fasciata monilis]|uniref:Uncharacterized protein n=1 Tax=Patagioenas fasciata monilis TaxID=372326 RepID=A0A1V4KN10_PATFA|nr:hypothetical protein AV530_013903 [Patagioenas fasciata monilis]